jgi:DNA modification methylase
MSTDALANLTPTTPLLLNGDCLELMKTLPDKSVDLFICDLPYGETNCAWDTRIDLGEFWSQFKRLRKSKKVACIHFCSTGFGYTLIKSWEKGFKMDMVWKKRNKTGGLQSRHRPMRNHEMVYFFYEQAPKYNRDKYHKRVKSAPMSVSAHQGTLPEQETKWRVKDIGDNASFQPASVIEAEENEEREYWDDQPSDAKTGHGWDITHMNTPRVPSFDPSLPVSVLEDNNTDPAPALEAEEEQPTIYGETRADAGWWVHNSFKGNENPASVFESTKCFFGKRNHQTEKPQDILEFFLKYWTDEGDVVLDPTMGGGSTGVACKKLGRNFIGCEMDTKYYEVCKKRIGEITPPSN